MKEPADRKSHWENVYTTKSPEQVSWTQEIPATSLQLIKDLGLPKDANIIDIGGGDSKLVDYLLADGFDHISVLDISAKALQKAQLRLGDLAKKVNWIERDILVFSPDEQFDVWHDRAAFHFLTSAEQIEKYIALVRKSVCGYLVIGTFSEQGPDKCSGLEIKKYSESSLTELLKADFEKLHCFTEEHITPFQTKQEFLFCSFKRKSTS